MNKNPAGRAAQRLLGALLLPLLSTAAPAQTLPPDAGQTLQQLKSQPLPPQQEKPRGGLLGEPGAAETVTDVDDTGPAVVVRQVKIEGNHVLDTALLQKQVAPLAGGRWTIGQLRAAAERITAVYREHGYFLARAYLPAQDLSEGLLTIAVLEGQLSRFDVSNPTRLKASRLNELLQAQFPPGTALQSNAANRALLLLQDWPGVLKVDGSLSPGEEVGSTALQLKLESQPLLTGYVAADNAGNRYTGRARVLGGINLNNASGYGDRLSVQALNGSGQSDLDLMQYGRVAWDMPMGNDGFRWGLSYSQVRYRLGDRFAVLEASGRTATRTAYISYPVIRSRLAQLNVSASYEKRDAHDEQKALGFESERGINAGNLTLDGSYVDGWLGLGAASTLQLALTQGLLGLYTDSVAAIDAATSQSAGHYLKGALTLSREQRLPQGYSLWLTASGQKTDRNLDSSEQFFLGGSNRVRAYPTGEAPGDEGWFVSAELRHALPLPTWRALRGLGVQGIGFYDLGLTDINHRPFIIDQVNAQRRAGAGIGLNASWRSFSFRTSAAWRVASPAPVSDSSRLPQLWFSGSWTF